MPAQKIATCCYCGTRAVLELRGSQRKELSCSSCGAPLHDLKGLPLRRQVVHRETPARSAAHAPIKKPRKDRKPKRRGIRWGKVFEEVFDAVDDIFD